MLASPLARRLAAERGLDLARLAAGRSEPIHAADLNALADAAAIPAAASTPMHVAAEAPAGELDALIAWAATQDAPLTPSRALAAFAAAALREATGHDGPPRRMPHAPEPAHLDAGRPPTAVRSRWTPARPTPSRT